MYRILLSLLILSGLTLMPFHATALDKKDKDLLLYFSFGEGKGDAVTDLSKQKNDGEIVGDADWVDGKFGKALEFSDRARSKLPILN